MSGGRRIGQYEVQGYDDEKRGFVCYHNMINGENLPYTEESEKYQGKHWACPSEFQYLVYIK